MVAGAAVGLSQPSAWASFSGRAVQFSGAQVDAEAISGGLWAYMPSVGHSSTINMMLTNRASGCNVDDAAHAGLSFYVNNWETADAALVLEWQERGGKCGRLSSDAGTVPLDAWAHLAFAMDPEHSQAMLFLNGALLKVGPCARAPPATPGLPSPLLSLGNSQEGAFPFLGNLAFPFLQRSVVSPAALSTLARATTMAAWAGEACSSSSSSSDSSSGTLAHLVLSGGELPKGAPIAPPQGLPEACQPSKVLRLSKGGGGATIAGDLALPPGSRLSPGDNGGGGGGGGGGGSSGVGPGRPCPPPRRLRLPPLPLQSALRLPQRRAGMCCPPRMPARPPAPGAPPALPPPPSPLPLPARPIPPP